MGVKEDMDNYFRKNYGGYRDPAVMFCVRYLCYRVEKLEDKLRETSGEISKLKYSGDE